MLSVWRQSVSCCVITSSHLQGGQIFRQDDNHIQQEFLHLKVLVVEGQLEVSHQRIVALHWETRVHRASFEVTELKERLWKTPILTLRECDKQREMLDKAALLKHTESSWRRAKDARGGYSGEDGGTHDQRSVGVRCDQRQQHQQVVSQLTIVMPETIQKLMEKRFFQRSAIQKRNNGII